MTVEVKSVPCTMEFDRLKMSVPLFVIALLVSSEPVVPPLPICRVPAVIKVFPV